MAKKQAVGEGKVMAEAVPAGISKAESEARWREKVRGCERPTIGHLSEWEVLVWEVEDYACTCNLSALRLWDVLWEEVAEVEGLDVPGLARRLDMTTRELTERLTSVREMSFERSVREALRDLDCDALRRVWEA
jgi:hypothetical protein